MQNIDIDKIAYWLEFGISNRATHTSRSVGQLRYGLEFNKTFSFSSLSDLEREKLKRYWKIWKSEKVKMRPTIPHIASSRPLKEREGATKHTDNAYICSISGFSQVTSFFLFISSKILLGSPLNVLFCNGRQDGLHQDIRWSLLMIFGFLYWSYIFHIPYKI